MSGSPLRHLDESVGAVRDERGLVLRYGSARSHSETEALRSHCALAEMATRHVIRLGGDDRKKLLQGIVSQDVSGLQEGQGCRAALLDPRGHVLSLLRILECGTEMLIETDGALRDSVMARLRHYKVAAKVTIAPTEESVLAVMGPLTRPTLEALGCPTPTVPESHAEATVAGVDARIVVASDLPAGCMLYCEPGRVETVWTALVEAGARPAGIEAIDTLRIEQGIPWQDPDVGPATLLHETGLVAALHSPSKGCYVGQEIVARLESRGGNVSRRLCRLALSGAVPSGTQLRHGDQTVGVLTTCGVSPQLGPCALGYVHRKHSTAGTTLSAAGEEARVIGPASEARSEK